MNALRWLLKPLSIVYGGVIRGRKLYYDRAPRAVRRAGIPVISVGNITVGGTGKTPMVIEIVRRLRAIGRRPAILTRGYRARLGETADEVLEFQEALPVVPVVVDPDRVAGAEAAQAAHGADCAVLDDGFQHRRLARDLDIVLIDALNPWGDGALLPAGRLREPPSSLRRADLLVLTRANQVAPAELERVQAALRRYAGDKPLVLAAAEAEALIYRDGCRAAPTELAARRVLAVCGLGNPQTFRRLVASLVGADCEARVFRDHHRYSMSDADAIVAAARRCRAELVVTTRKDWVKLAPLWPDADVALARLDLRLALAGAVAELDARLRQAVEKHP
jgi:tetraacyldisaccharide 4'-kinase